MTDKKILVLAAVLTMFLGLAWMLLPDALLQAWGTGSNGVLDFMSRRYAVLFLGYTVLLWLASKSSQPETRRIVMTGSLVATSLMACTSLSAVLAGTINLSGLIAFSVEALLSLAFAYSLKRQPTRSNTPI